MLHVIDIKRFIAAFASLGMAACATTPILKPVPTDTLAPGTKDIAQANVAGVQLQVGGDVWNGDPPNLGQLFTPVKVTIVNQSGKTLRVSYVDFNLGGSSGFKSAAIPPMSAQGEISLAPSNDTPRVQLADWGDRFAPHFSYVSQLSYETPRVQLASWRHRFDHDRFLIAPHFSYMYPGWGVWPYRYPYDPMYYGNLYLNWPEHLPTQDMLSNALPEGVVQNDGKVSGFVYFQGVGNRESSVTFTMNLVDATNGQQFGQVSIPFVVGKQ